MLFLSLLTEGRLLGICDTDSAFLCVFFLMMPGGHSSSFILFSFKGTMVASVSSVFLR